VRSRPSTRSGRTDFRATVRGALVEPGTAACALFFFWRRTHKSESGVLSLTISFLAEVCLGFKPNTWFMRLLTLSRKWGPLKNKDAPLRAAKWFLMPFPSSKIWNPPSLFPARSVPARVRLRHYGERAAQASFQPGSSLQTNTALRLPLQ
jgi:hypothetical protein